MNTRATTWAAWIAAVLMLVTASGTASASSVFLSPNSCQGKITLEGGLHRGSSAVSAATHRGCGEVSLCDAAGLFVAPKTWQDFLPEAQMRLDATKARLGNVEATMMARPRYIPGYGYQDPKYWKLVKQLQAGESIQAKNLRMAAELRRDAFPDLVRSRYRGPLSEAPDLRGTYDWHNPQRMIHPGPHQTPHIQIKLQDGTIVRIEVPQ
jgi:hypothetical protein